MLLPVILAGGVGSRLWPVSRSLSPKQFIQFPGQDETLFQGTLSRLEGLDNLLNPLVICNEDHRFLVAEQLRQLGKEGSKILLEPVGKNTAPAVALAAIYAQQQQEDPILLVLPADHLIEDTAKFHEALMLGQELAARGSLVTFGILPNAPKVGYGYIKCGQPAEQGPAKQVARFVEKPNLEVAQQYLDSGNYLWNSGMFMFKASTYLAQLSEFAEDIHSACESTMNTLKTESDFLKISEAQFSTCRSDSIDYAVMEKTKKAVVVPLDANRNDLGSWDAICDTQEKDEHGNATNGDVLLSSVSNSYVQSQSRLVAAIGISDSIIIETADSILVASKDRLQEVKEIVKRLEIDKRNEAVHHTLVHRPWGSYESLAVGANYQVKHLIIKPGAAISLQLHYRRSEHWTVIKGTGRITVGEKVFALGLNESTFIPVGEKHRLQNLKDGPLELIEIQVGAYLVEDDIERLDDDYGRLESDSYRS
jgi:mannose-1-phosphate guanylyltransferase/mannose-6-phosphate isomerase